MTELRHTLRLDGCRPEPLAHYLKALAILRLVSEQVDPHARGAWEGDTFVLASSLDREGLTRFLLDEWRPTPVISPWNGGSGFYAKDNKTGPDALTSSVSARFERYRAALALGRSAVERFRLSERPAPELKPAFVSWLRARLDDEALPWLDAALTITSDGMRFPPLLGTGGNDGRLDFSNNFMQRVVEVVGEGSDRLRSGRLLACALFDDVVPQLTPASVGQFFPAAAGGANSGPGFSGNSVVNPWDFVLMIEGALLFCAASTRRLDATGQDGMVFPFAVRAVGSGYASAADHDEEDSRDELWLPLWRNPTSLPELRLLFGEGRAKVGGRTAQNAVDFARALGELGVDRGISAFTRYGFHVRNGLAVQAVPLGRWRVRRNMHVDLLAPIDGWLQRVRRFSKDKGAPASVARAARKVERAILALCERNDPTRVEQVLIALGELEQQLGASLRFARDAEISPVPWLPSSWLEGLPDGDPEVRLALALASRGLRGRLRPVGTHMRPTWLEASEPSVTWTAGGLVRNLVALTLREDVEAARGERTAPRGLTGVSLDDLASFVEGTLDETRIERLLHGLALVAPAGFPRKDPPATGRRPPPAYSLFALLRQPVLEGVTVPRAPEVARLLAAGRGTEASAVALRRLHASGLPLRTAHRDRTAGALAGWPVPSTSAARLLAATAFPLGPRTLESLLHEIVLMDPNPQETAP